MKKLLALTLALLMAVSLVACGDDDQEREDLKNYLQNEEVINFVTLESGETYYFDQVDSETVTITSYKCSNEKHALVIPDQLNGKTVVGISDQAFKANNDITSITIPATVTEIGDFVFAECAQVTEVTIPASVTSLGKYIFTNCTALETDDRIHKDRRDQGVLLLRLHGSDRDHDPRKHQEGWHRRFPGLQERDLR